MIHRDLDVFKTVQMKYNIPIAILLGGGNEVSISNLLKSKSLTSQL